MPSEALIDGLERGSTSAPSQVLPMSASDVADVLADADREGLGVIPVGGGTKRALGNIPIRSDIMLSTAGLNQILHFEPTDLTFSVEAGATYAAVREALGQKGQHLPIDVADPEAATIGGLVATALVGPRRTGAGSLRDLLIGINVAYPSGILAKAGGLVVKNVTGFDLMRLHHGALGTLGVIVSANFKTLPLERAERTLLFNLETLEDGWALIERIRVSRATPTALELIAADDGWTLALRLSGRETTVALLSREIVSAVTCPVAAEFSGAESIGWWQSITNDESPASNAECFTLRVSVRPAETARLVETSLRVLSSHSLSISRIHVSPTLGTMLVQGSQGGDSKEIGFALSLQRQLLEHAEHTVFLSAPIAWKKEIDVWGRVPEAFAVMRAVKSEYDPNHVLNPGRFVGHL